MIVPPMTHGFVILGTLVCTVCSRCRLDGGLNPLLAGPGNVLTGTSVIFGFHRVDIRVIHAWGGCLRAHPNVEFALVISGRRASSWAVFKQDPCGVVSRVKDGEKIWSKTSATTGLHGRFPQKLTFHIHMFFRWLPFSWPAITFPSTHHSQIFLPTLTDK